MYTSDTFYFPQVYRLLCSLLLVLSITQCATMKSGNVTDQSPRYSVHFIMMMECKISIAMTPHIQAITEKYEPFSQFQFIAHFPETFVPDGADLHKWREDYRLDLECRVDSSDVQTAALGATRAPQAIVVDETTHQIIYSGRINNLFAALGKRRSQVTDHTLDQILEQITKGKTLKTQTTQVVGCALN